MFSKKNVWYTGFTSTAIILAVFLLQSPAATSREYQTGKPMPEFTHSKKNEWINSEPISIADLEGKVVLIDFWTFDCWNCYRSFPWLVNLEETYQKQGLQIIGIHTPEFDHEKVRENVLAKANEFKLHHPIMMDNDFSYWKAANNHYWPAFYVLDKNGNLRGRFFGETHAGDKRAKQIENLISRLLAEPNTAE